MTNALDTVVAQKPSLSAAAGLQEQSTVHQVSYILAACCTTKRGRKVIYTSGKIYTLTHNMLNQTG